VSDQQIAWLGREQSEQTVEAEQLLVAQSDACTVTSFHHGDGGGGLRLVVRTSMMSVMLYIFAMTTPLCVGRIKFTHGGRRLGNKIYSRRRRVENEFYARRRRWENKNNARRRTLDNKIYGLRRTLDNKINAPRRLDNKTTNCGGGLTNQ
jgi:hypothetical protein